ncbi:MAG: hypothetical protein CVV36_07025 [Candidatus Methanoperedenaceae archaeon HGW-Methanoperedenaceae-1]|nr:MAG: hypothetical protein CVV36_07025 [Candidatus Methanoperedenaceae archaeon HGW-Methanoperedenaceae-1]
MAWKKIIPYNKLNSKQKENYNFQKVSSILADYGFNTLRLSDDWQGADFIAAHKDGETFLKVQLKSRLTFSKKYLGKDIWVCFPHKKDEEIEPDWYLYPHDEFKNKLNGTMDFQETDSWKKQGGYSTNKPNKKVLSLLEKYYKLSFVPTNIS